VSNVSRKTRWIAGLSRLRALTARLSFRAGLKAGEGGKTSVSTTRWINTRGEKGPRSEITTATVAA